MSKAWSPRLPKQKPYCTICGEPVTTPPFIASKPQKGTIIYAHTDCLKREKEEKNDTGKRNRA